MIVISSCRIILRCFTLVREASRKHVRDRRRPSVYDMGHCGHGMKDRNKPFRQRYDHEERQVVGKLLRGGEAGWKCVSTCDLVTPEARLRLL